MKSSRPNDTGDKDKKASVPIVDSLLTALSLLDHFSLNEPELSLSQLSEKSGLYKSRVHRLCGTLVVAGFLVRMPLATYRLGPKLMKLGKIYENTNTILTVSRPVMKELAGITGESVALFRLKDDRLICLARELGTSRLVFAINEGDDMLLHASAAGRVLLTWGTDELRQRILGKKPLQRFTPETLVDPQKIEEKFSLIRARGYAVNRSETELEVAAVAAPIFDHEQKVDAALVVVGPAQRFSDEYIPGISANLLASTRKISNLLGAAEY